MTSQESQNGELQRGQPIGDRKVLESLPSRARTTNDQAAARSRLVKRLRVALPITALVLIAAFFFNTQNQGPDSAFLDEFTDLTSATEELKMANPRFAGVDDKGVPFEITADYAIQPPEDREFVLLERPKAIQGDEGEANTVTAEKGVFSSESNILELSDGVQLNHRIGNEIYVFRSDAATVSIDDETVISDVGVGGEGPDGGSLKADRMQAYNGEGRVVFEGGVSMRIYPKSSHVTDATDNKAADDELAASNNENG